MKRDTGWNLAVLVLLVAFGVCGRLVRPMENFTPAVAVALFAGFYFSQRRWAVAAPLLVMAISNLFLPVYHGWLSIAAVYAGILFPVALRGCLGRRPSAARLAACATSAQLVFFVLSNFAVWASGKLDYDFTWAGLTECYVAGLPFLRNMLLGDLCFTGLLFGTYLIATRPASSDLRLRRRQPALVPVRASTTSAADSNA